MGCRESSPGRPELCVSVPVDVLDLLRHAIARGASLVEIERTLGRLRSGPKHLRSHTRQT